MNLILNKNKYRVDIDGLRAIAVLAVIFFHFGILPYGYLGVDIFFVISGFLITNIIYQEIQEDRFSIAQFYMRRIRRILPLSLFIVTVALAIGYFTMLPDDLENLAQSVVATNGFSNNILQAITTKNYWDVVNDYKPLMHTWSLGIEEQYYFLYPLIFLALGRKYIKAILPIIVVLTLVSVGLYSMPQFEDHEKFYYLPFRFFELSIGAIAAIILKNKLIDGRWITLSLLLLIFILFGIGAYMPESLLIPITVVLSAFVLSSHNSNRMLTKSILENKTFIFLGKISFGLYLWHQLLLSFTRYIFIQELEYLHLALIFVGTVVLSTVTYYWIEQPFRNKKKVSSAVVLSAVVLLFTVTTVTSLCIYFKAGVVRDVPELEVYSDNAQRNMHAVYNDRIYQLQDKAFSSKEKLKVLLIGNSFARDFGNVLLESRFKDSIEISYIYRVKDKHKRLIENSDYIFATAAVSEAAETWPISNSKLWIIGIKNFGVSNGIFYNSQAKGYLQQRTDVENRYLVRNRVLRGIWGERYIDYISPVVDVDGRMPVFTPEGKFISQDCRHLTHAGALLYAKIFEEKLATIFSE